MNYTEAQRRAVNARGNVLVLASPGSGKTTLIAERTKELLLNGIRPSEILILTFSKKAQENLIKRVNQGGITIKTFHAFSLEINNKDLKIISNDSMKRDILMIGLKKQSKAFNKIASIGKIIEFISDQKLEMLGPNDEPIYDYRTEAFISEYVEIYKFYEEYKFNHNMVDFDDLIINTIKLLDDGLQLSYKYIMVDEYQDVNLPQAELIRALSKGETFVVGDPLQSIYEFRGSSSMYLLDFPLAYDDVSVINMNTNFRCSESIVEYSNQIAAKQISATKSKHYKASVAVRKGGSKPIYKRYKSKVAECQAIIRKIKAFSDEYEYNDIAILARTNDQLQAIQGLLMHNNIPFVLPNNTSFLDLPEINMFLPFLRLSMNLNANEDFLAVCQSPYLKPFFTGSILEEIKASNPKSYYKAIQKYSEEIRYKLGIYHLTNIIELLIDSKLQNVGERIEFIKKALHLNNYYNYICNNQDSYDEIMSSIEAFQEYCYSFNTTRSFLKAMEKKDTLAQTENAVQIMTIHKSKGLEFPVVFILGLDKDHMPHPKSATDDEEARILYVGMTRASYELHMSYSGKASKFLK